MEILIGLLIYKRFVLNEVDITIPESLHQILARIAQVMTKGDAITVVPITLFLYITRMNTNLGVLIP